jgi:hypothetical protein
MNENEYMDVVKKAWVWFKGLGFLQKLLVAGAAALVYWIIPDFPGPFDDIGVTIGMLIFAIVSEAIE